MIGKINYNKNKLSKIKKLKNILVAFYLSTRENESTPMMKSQLP